MLLGYELPKRGEWQISIYKTARQHDQRPNLDTVADRQKQYAQKYAPPVPPLMHFEEGEEVLTRKTGPQTARPFDTLWEGPFKITKRITPEIYEVSKRRKLTQYHIDDIRKSPQPNPPVESSTSESKSSNDNENYPPAREQTSPLSEAPAGSEISSNTLTATHTDEEKERRRRSRLMIKVVRESASAEVDSTPESHTQREDVDRAQMRAPLSPLVFTRPVARRQKPSDVTRFRLQAQNCQGARQSTKLTA